MVVPVEPHDPPINLGEVKKFVGNNLRLNFLQNRGTLLVIGNGASLKIAQNFGLVKVIGNNCVVDMTECPGSVQYIGNNGKILLEDDVRADTVSYVGLSGSLVCKKKKVEKKATPATPNQLPNIQVVDHAILIKNNVRVRNPCISVNVSGIHKILPLTVLTS